MNYPGQSPSGVTFPQDHGLRVGPRVGSAGRPGCQCPRPRDSLTPASSGRSGSHAPAPKTKQRSRNIGPKSPRGAGSTPWDFRPAAPGPPGPAGCVRGAVSLSPRGRPGPQPPGSWSGLPPCRAPPRPASVARPALALTLRPLQPPVGQSVPNSVHTQRLPAPAGSSSSAGQEVWPPPTHTPTFLPPGGAGGRRAPRFAAQGSAPGPRTPWSPTSHSSSIGLRGPRSAKPAKRVGSFPP